MRNRRLETLVTLTREKVPSRAWMAGWVLLSLWTALALLPHPVRAASGAGILDAGGHRAASTTYTLDSSIGSFGGLASYEATRTTVKAGLLRQLYEVTNLVVTALPGAVDEADHIVLGAVAELDDGTVTLLSGADVSWRTPVFPLTSIDGSGLALAAHVYQDALATVFGAWSGGLGTGSVSVRNRGSDDFGLYAEDGLPDPWQVQYFGENNCNALPDAVAGAPGQNNLFNYTAGLNPTNPASVFQFRIQPTEGLGGRQALFLSPRFEDRTYTILCGTSLETDLWRALTSFTILDRDLERVVTDTEATSSARFYRLQISLP